DLSDTTIAATRTQKVEMHEKFRANFRIVFPVALVVFILYYFQGAAFVQEVQNIDVKDYQLIYLIPYTLVFLLAFMGLSVIWTLGIGILAGLIIGWSTGAIDLRSEEHTSELQSRENLVCRLLLEKKKTAGDR